MREPEAERDLVKAWGVEGVMCQTDDAQVGVTEGRGSGAANFNLISGGTDSLDSPR